MASYVTPKKGVEFITYISLEATAGGSLVASPTIAAGDFKVSIDGGALANLATLPTNTPAASGMVKITLSTSEMNGDNITVKCVDAAGAEWLPVTINIQTSARQLDDLAYPTVSGRSIDVSAGGEVGLDWANVGSPTTTLALTGTTIATTQKVDVETIKTNPVVNAGTVTFPTTATLASTTNITAGTITTATNVTTVNGLAANVITAAATAADFGTEVASAVWDEDATAHQTQGTFGQAIGDPGADTDSIWALANTNLDATVSSRLASASYTTPLDAAGTATAVWNAATATYGSAGSYGLLIETNLDAASSTLATAANLSTLTGYVDTEVAAIKAKTDQLTFTTANRVDSQVFGMQAGTVTASAIATDAIDADAIAADAVTEIQSGLSTLTAAGIRTAVGLASANLDTQLDALPTAAENAAAVLTTAMTESYAADGVAPTLEQAIFQTMQSLTEFSISGTTITVKKLDGTTTAATYTLDDATTPTSRTRAT